MTGVSLTYRVGSFERYKLYPCETLEVAQVLLIIMLHSHSTMDKIEKFQIHIDPDLGGSSRSGVRKFDSSGRVEQEFDYEDKDVKVWRAVDVKYTALRSGIY